MSHRPVRFYLKDDLQTLAAVPPTRTVLEWLREDCRLTGTKEGCAEGDCGACTVVVGEAIGGRLRYRAINSCITFVAALDGKQLITVEHLRGANGVLHPVQQALVQTHGSQCGFCTPGFVMSLYALYQQKRQRDEHSVTRTEAAEALSGNLCRCTGYRPIVDAAMAMTAAPWLEPDEAAMAAKLAALAAAPALEQRSASGAVYAPRTLAELVHLRAALPQARLVAGSTDVGLWVTKRHQQLGTLILTGRVAELLAIEETAEHLVIGAAVPLTDALGRLAQQFPATRDYWQRYGSPPVRNSGTLGGNVANGSPIGDSMPVLIALGAEVVLASPRGERRLALEDFYIGYQRTALAPDEVLRSICIALQPARIVHAYKLSKRFDQDISALALGIALQFDGAVLRELRIGVGGMAATPRRAVVTEAVLRGQRFDEAALRAAQAALGSEFTPISDMRASAAYRRRAAQNLLHRVWLDSSPLAPRGVPTSVHEVSA